MRRLSIYLIILSFFFSFNTLAFEKYWGSTDHRVVGKIAYSYLTGKTKRAINKLLNNQ